MYKKSDKELFLDRAKRAREERALEKQKMVIVSKILRNYRAKLSYRTFIGTTLNRFDQMFSDVGQLKTTENEDIFAVLRPFLLIWSKNRDFDRVKKLVQYLMQSFEDPNRTGNFLSELIKPQQFVNNWLVMTKKILRILCSYLDTFRPEIPTDANAMLKVLLLMVSFTAIQQHSKFLKDCNFDGSATTERTVGNISEQIIVFLVFEANFFDTLKKLLFRGINRSQPSLKTVPLSAIVLLMLRPQTIDERKSEFYWKFAQNFLPIPALFDYMKRITPERFLLFQNLTDFVSNIFRAVSQNLDRLLSDFGPNETLFLFANLIHLSSLQNSRFFNQQDDRIIYQKILNHIRTFLRDSKTVSLTNWHPILGCYATKNHSNDQISTEIFASVKSQLCFLWESQLLMHILGDPLAKANEQIDIKFLKTKKSTCSSIILRKLKSLSSLAANDETTTIYIVQKSIGDQEIDEIYSRMDFYYMLTITFAQLKMDILSGICYRDHIILHLWHLIMSYGSNFNFKYFSDKFIANNRKIDHLPELKTLQMFFDCMIQYITVLDDFEMYERGTLFNTEDYMNLAIFVNHLYYELLTDNESSFEKSVSTLLMTLYRRDCRRNFMISENQWLVKNVKVTSVQSDYVKGKKSAVQILEKMPHIIPFDIRLKLFEHRIDQEKRKDSYNSTTFVRVRRTCLIEDGFHFLNDLRKWEWRSMIRVTFVNEQGLDEPGIDQDGMFKELIEEIVKKIFNPELNLFRVTKSATDERFYPSPTSAAQDNHLKLLEFAGQLIGKAVFESIVVDVPFALFFLSQLLGQTQQELYSAIDELPSFDPELYRNLTFVKSYDGDVSDLELTFSYDEEFMGQITTHELVPGGKSVAVTNKNKISYVHLMAHFRLHTQIKQQTMAFNRGFFTVIDQEWLQMFSAPELQTIISGSNTPLNFEDLRRNTTYFGGFHEFHEVIKWLWDILINEFDEKEKAAFLKFVTSCSKAPIKGFESLEPRFSIRCVEVGDINDTGDTLGSVIRGYFRIRKKKHMDRLPTSSTCFNLLKLPNYSKKETLREKLRYAIECNSGFELS